MTIDLLHNKILRSTVTEGFKKSIEENLVPKLRELYGESLEGIQMYEDYINDEFLKDGHWYYPLTVVIGGVSAVLWIKWDISESSLFAEGIPYAYLGEGNIDFTIADEVPIYFKKAIEERANYFEGGYVKVDVSTDAPGATVLAGKYSQTFIDEMTRQLDGAISRACGISGLAQSSIEIFMFFAPGTYMEHTSENVTYRRLLISAKGCAARDFWIKWTRLDSAAAFSVNDNVNEDNILFEIGEDVSHKIREKEYRFLVYGNSDRYRVAMGRKNITEWRELIKRSLKRGELEKTTTELEEREHASDVSDKLSEILEKCGIAVPDVAAPAEPSGADIANEALRVAVLGEAAEGAADTYLPREDAAINGAATDAGDSDMQEFNFGEGISLSMNESGEPEDEEDAADASASETFLFAENASDEEEFEQQTIDIEKTLPEHNETDMTEGAFVFGEALGEEASADKAEDNNDVVYAEDEADEATVYDVGSDANAEVEEPAAEEPGESVPEVSYIPDVSENASSDLTADDDGEPAENAAYAVRDEENNSDEFYDADDADDADTEEIDETIAKLSEMLERAGEELSDAREELAKSSAEMERLRAELESAQRATENEKMLREEAEKYLKFERVNSSDLRAQIEKHKEAAEEAQAVMEEAVNARNLAEAETDRLRAEQDRLVRDNERLIEEAKAAQDECEAAEAKCREYRETLEAQIILHEKESARAKDLFAEAARQARAEGEREAKELARKEAARLREEARIAAESHDQATASYSVSAESDGKIEAESDESYVAVAPVAEAPIDKEALRLEAINKAKELRLQMEEEARTAAEAKVLENSDYNSQPVSVAAPDKEVEATSPTTAHESIAYETTAAPAAVPREVAYTPAQVTYPTVQQVQPEVRYTYISKLVRIMFRNSVDPNITSRLHEMIATALAKFNKESVYIKVKASIPDNTTVVLNFVKIPEEEIKLLIDIIHYLGNSDLGIYKIILE